MANLRSFNLVTGAWINALYLDGTNRIISLKQVFNDWRDIACINGTTTANTMALDRFLCILLMKVTGGVANEKAYQTLLNDTRLGQKINDYLGQNQELFTIGDPQKPFMQVPAVMPYINHQGTNTFRIAGIGKEDIYGFDGTLKQPPDFSAMEIAQYILRESFMAGGGLSDRPIEAIIKSQKISGWGNEAKASAGVLYNRSVVSLRAGTLRETLLLNIPQGAVEASELAPWERQREAIPAFVTPTTVFQAMTVMTRSILLIWDNDNTLHGVYSGVGDRLPKDWLEALPTAGLIPQNPTIATSNGLRVFLKPQKNAPLWKDLTTLFSSGADDVRGNGIKPAPIVGWWQQLGDAGLMPSEVAYVISSTVTQRNGQGNIIAATINELSLPTGLFGETSMVGQLLFSLFKFISDIDRNFFRLNNGGNGKAKEKSQLAPLSLFRLHADLFPKDSPGELRMMNRYPVSGQFLTLVEPIFLQAMQEAMTGKQLDQAQLKEWVNAYKQQILDLATTCWERIIFSVPLTTPKYFKAAGHAHSQIRRLTNIYRKQITGAKK